MRDSLIGVRWGISISDVGKKAPCTPKVAPSWPYERRGASKMAGAGMYSIFDGSFGDTRKNRVHRFRMAAGTHSDRENRGYPARGGIGTRRASGIASHNMDATGKRAQAMARDANDSPYIRAKTTVKQALGSPVCSLAIWMHSKIEYIGPDYRQNVMISLPGYPRGGYVCETVGPPTGHRPATHMLV